MSYRYMNQKGFANINLVIIIVVILVGVVGYFTLVKKSGLIGQEPAPTKIPISPITTPRDETANWKTYTNTIYGFTIKYPSELTTLEAQNMIANSELGISFRLTTGAPENREKYNLSIFARSGTLADQIKDLNLAILGNPGPFQETVQANIVLGTTEVPAIRVIRSQKESDLHIIVIYLEKNNKLFVFRNDGTKDVTFDYFVSTIEFSSPGTTANWKTYRVSGYNGYEFKYPQDYTLLTGDKLAQTDLQSFWAASGGAVDVAVKSQGAAYFSASRHGYIANLVDCRKVTWPNGQTQVLTVTQVINGITFYRAPYNGVAAGTRTEYWVYRTFGGSGGDGCFELVNTVSVPSAESPGFNVDDAWNKLDQILNTFKFAK